MIKRTPAYFAALLDAAPVLVVPFGKGASRVVPQCDIGKVKSGVITMSPIAVFFQQCGFVWEAWAIRSELKAKYSR